MRGKKGTSNCLHFLFTFSSFLFSLCLSLYLSVLPSLCFIFSLSLCFLSEESLWSLVLWNTNIKIRWFQLQLFKAEKQQKMGGMLWPQSRHQHAETCMYAGYENKHHTRCHALISPAPYPSYGPCVCVPCTCLYACESLKGEKKNCLSMIKFGYQPKLCNSGLN